jgi:hypothetical protein
MEKEVISHKNCKVLLNQTIDESDAGQISYKEVFFLVHS